MLEEIKKLLGIDDNESDSLLEVIINTTKSRLLVLINEKEVPATLSYIVTEVSIIRFNKIGSEGLKSHTVANETLTWEDDDFSAYQADIQAYLSLAKTTKKGKLRFI